jgi:hypothetical protein
MQLRCTYCQTMFALSRDDMLAALEHMEENKQIFYDAHCPKCRRANRVERARMERFFPDWKKTLREMAREAETAQAEVKPVAPKAEAVKKTAAQPVKKSLPKDGLAKKAPVSPKPAPRSAARKPAAKAKPAQKASAPSRAKPKPAAKTPAARPKAKSSGAGKK